MEMLPRGTKTRSAQQIAEFFDSIGGDLETDCGNNTWSWNMTCLKDDFPKAMQVYADVVRNPAFAEAELPAVKQRIVAAIDSQDADWHAQASRFFRKVYFGPSKSPYQFVVVGEKQVVEQATAGQMREWYETKVLKAQRVIAVYGDVYREQAQNFVQDVFGGKIRELNAITVPGSGVWVEGNAPPSVKVERVDLQQTEQPLAGIVIGFKSDSVIGYPDPALGVIDTMTSGHSYPTGYLFDILRGRGLVYVVHAYDMPGIKPDLPGTFIVYAGCDPKNVNAVVDLILENIARCQGTTDDMRQDWFERSKQLMIAGEALENETPAQQAQRAALDELFGLGYDYRNHAKFADRINAVTINQVRDVARAKLSACVVTVSTPQPDLVNRKTGVREYEKFPPVELAPAGVQHEGVK
jgi:zinc protease